jgi:hypothetical protein
MSKIVRVQGGDYKVIVGSETTPGNITFDTNPLSGSGEQGKVTITGDLEVQGNTTTISSQDLSIIDNIIYVNRGETGAGVSTLGSTSGLQIDRGSLPDVSFLWDELLTSNVSLSGGSLTTSEGTFVFRNASSVLQPIATNSINSGNNNLVLLSSGGTGVVTVAGTANYHLRVLDYTRLNIILDITAVRRVAGVATVVLATPHNLSEGDRVFVLCNSNGSFNSQIGESTTVILTPTSTSFTYANPGLNVATPSTTVPASGTVRINPVLNDDIIPNMRAIADYTNLGISSNRIFENDTQIQVKDFDSSGVSEISFDVDGLQRALVNNNGFIVDNIRISDNNISNISNDNILIDNVLNIANKVSVPSTPVGYVKVYSRNTPGTGGTGLYFVNTIGTNDELISKTKALLYSLIL